MTRARAGDIGAYEHLVRRYQDVAIRTAYVIAPDGDADDACQEAFVKAWQALPRFRPDAPFRPWLLRIVINEARNRRRSAARRAGLRLRAESMAGSPAGAASPELRYLDSESRERLLDAVRSLRDDDREVVAARYFLGLSEAETAHVLGLPAGTVKSRLSRALGRLRSDLDRRGADDR